MFGDFTGKEELYKYIPNYRINLVEPAKMEDVSCFKTDLHMVFGMLKYKNKKDELLVYTKNNYQYFEKMDIETFQAVGILLGATKYIEGIIDKEKEEQNMCKALDDLYNEGVERGLEQGISKSVLMLRKVGTTDESILELLQSEYNLSKEVATGYLS